MNSVLMIGNFEKSWDGSVCDELHIALAFQKFKWEVTLLPREETDILPDAKPSFVLIAQWNGYSEDMVDRLRMKYNCPIVYWAFDYQWDSNEEWHFRLAKEVDLFLSKEMDHKQDYEKMGANFHWFSQDFAPEFLDIYKEDDVDKIYEVIFTGTYLPQAEFRNAFLKEVDNNFDLHIFSVTEQAWKDAGFRNVYPAVVDHGLPELYAKSDICLSVDWKQADGYWSDRMAQILCCGGFVINKYVSGQENLYPFATYFDSIEDGIRLIDLMLMPESDQYKHEYRVLGHMHAQNSLKVVTKVRALIHMLNGKGLLSPRS